MNYYYNQYGWYTSEETENYTELEPSNTDEPTTHGELRSWFNGVEWSIIPYTLPEYYYDVYGWISIDPIPGRVTSQVPSSVSQTEVEGELRPNFTGYVWVDLPYHAPVAPPLEVVEKHITLLALNLRMTRSERDAIRTARLTDSDVDDIMYLMSVARYIDLNRPETIGGLQMLESKGLLGAGRAAAILNGAIQDSEKP